MLSSSPNTTFTSYQKRWRPRIVTLGASFLVLMLSAALSEGVSFVYLRFRGSPLGTLASLYQVHPLFGWFHKRNTRLQFHFHEPPYESTHEISISDKGLRDKDRQYKKAPGVSRILVLGDSIVFAHQVPQKDRFSDIIESRFGNEGNRRPIEVINAGVNAYGTANEFLYLLHEGFKYDPDLVILTVFLGNDVMDNHRTLARRLPHFIDGPYFTVSKSGLSLKNFPASRSIWRQSHTYVLASNLLGKYAPGVVRQLELYNVFTDVPLVGEFVQDGVPLPLLVYQQAYDDDWRNAWRITKSLLDAFRVEATKRHVEVLVLLVPDKIQLGNGSYWDWIDQKFPSFRESNPNINKPSRVLTQWLTEEQILFVDLLPIFKKYEASTNTLLYFKEDVHLNRNGHRLIAEVLFTFLAGHRQLVDNIDRAQVHEGEGAVRNGR